VILVITTADGDANIVLSGWPLDSFLWRNVRLIDGHIPSADDQWEVVLGGSIAATLGKHVGDTIELQYQPYRIVGIADFATVLNQNIALVPLAGLQKLLALKNTVTLYQIRLKRPFDAGQMTEIAQRVRAATPGYSVTSTDEFTSNLRFFAIVRAFTGTVSIVVLAMALLAIANTLLMAVHERTHELGVLSSIGWSPARVLGMILIEGLVMSAIGGIIGIGLGIAAMNLVSLSHIASGLLEPYVNASIVAQAMISVLVMGPLGALYPAWRAVKLVPAEALRAL
jgi:putative ABC transport system permease protein